MISMFVYREINLAKLANILVETGIVTGKVMIMVGMASAFAWILTREQVPQALANFIFSHRRGKDPFPLHHQHCLSLSSGRFWKESRR